MKRGVAVIITNDNNEVLLLKRSRNTDHDCGMRENCGGEVKDGESLEETAEREVKDETGCKLISLSKIYSANFSDYDFTVTVFQGKIAGVPKVGDSTEHDEVKWFNKEEWKNLPLASYARKDFEKIGWT